MQYDETWTNQDLLWAALKSHKSFKGQRLPPKSDPRAWKLALDNDFEYDGEAVILTATMHLSTSKVGPALKPELHPLKREQSSRLFRHFGSDRFLEVRVPAVDSWQSGEKDMETIAARWLTRAPHRFVERRWAGFYVRDRPLKVEIPEGKRGLETRTVFYDRVLLFAEEGRGLAPPPSRVKKWVEGFSSTVGRARKTACSRNDMLNWLLNLEENGEQSYLKLFHRVALGMSPHINPRTQFLTLTNQQASAKPPPSQCSNRTKSATTPKTSRPPTAK